MMSGARALAECGSLGEKASALATAPVTSEKAGSVKSAVPLHDGTSERRLARPTRSSSRSARYGMDIAHVSARARTPR
jgi:hypothetical protein